jgi:hypothetical protein
MLLLTRMFGVTASDAELKEGRDAHLTARLAEGIFATPGVYPAIVRFANAD